MLLCGESKGLFAEERDTIAIIADALHQKFGADALDIAVVQRSTAGESRATWIAIVERLRG
jgi:hypothetical protein